MLRKDSGVRFTLVTVPIGKPLGKIASPPLVRTISPAATVSSDMTLSKTTSPTAVPRNTPCRREFSRMAPTPLDWSLINNTCEVEPYTCSTLPTTPPGVITAMSTFRPSLEPLSIKTERDSSLPLEPMTCAGKVLATNCSLNASRFCRRRACPASSDKRTCSRRSRSISIFRSRFSWRTPRR